MLVATKLDIFLQEVWTIFVTAAKARDHCLRENFKNLKRETTG